MITLVESLPPVRTLRYLAHVVLALLAVVSVSRPVSAQLLEGLDSAGRVSVSRNEVRIYFPPPPLSVWSMSVTPSARREPRRMMWAAKFDGATTVRLWYSDSSTTRPSLQTIVRTGRVSFCRENMANSDCSSANLAATVGNDSIVLIYRDSAEIRQSFGLHPTAVMLLLNFPWEMEYGGIFAAPVRYIDPPIILDSAERVMVGKERRRREARVNSYSRGIAGGPHGRTLSMVVGDSVDVLVQYSHCLVDLCSEYDFDDRERRDWGQWSLSDSSVATLHRLNAWGEAAGFPANDDDRARKLVARRPGRATLRISGVHTAADTMPSSTALDSILEREIIVTPAVRRP